MVLRINLFGYSIATLHGGETENPVNGTKALRNGFNGMLEAGIPLVRKERFLLYPLLGAGFNAYTYKIHETQSLSAAQVGANYGREISLYHGSFALDLSLNASFLGKLHTEEKTGYQSFYLSSLRLGYLYTIPNASWSYSGGDIQNGPDFGIRGFYAKLGFGFGSVYND